MRDANAGDEFRVLKPNAYLMWYVPCGPNCWQGASLHLQVGDVIKYERNAYGGGSDDVNYDYFSKDGKCGAFWPNKWGSCDRTFIEVVAKATGGGA